MPDLITAQGGRNKKIFHIISQVFSLLKMFFFLEEVLDVGGGSGSEGCRMQDAGL